MGDSAKRSLPPDQENNSSSSKKCKSENTNDPARTKPDPVSQVFNDPVHGFIELHPLLVKIINTPQFQRLKDIKQLGICYWVFPGASHNRFEHSLGTSFLCGQMIERLQQLHRNEFEITDQEVLCVKIAGLCHDLGHGPFSHFFDGVYIPRVLKEREKLCKGKGGNIDGGNGDGGNGNDRDRSDGNGGNACSKEEFPQEWSHEDASCALFDLMLADNPEVEADFCKYDLGENERSFIKELIQGKDPSNEKEKVRVCSFTKKPKWFLYEIVSNKRNGIDCDKFDYFARDCFNVGVRSNFDSRRYFQNIRVIPVDGQLQICVRDKEVFNLYELFHTRWSLHHRVYQHKTHAAIEHLLVEALLKVDQKLGISSAITDMRRYAYLTDSIIYEILRKESNDPDILEAQELILRIQRRELFKFCGQTQQLPAKTCSRKNGPRAHDDQPAAQNVQDHIPQDHQTATPIVQTEHDHLSQRQNDQSAPDVPEDPISQDDPELAPGPSEEKIAKDMAELSHGTLTADQVFVKVIDIHFGMKHKDPVDSVVFFNKAHQPLKVRKNQVSQVLPSMFHERYFRVYAKSRDNIETVERCFAAWCRQNNYPVPRMLEGDRTGYFSPAFKSCLRHVTRGDINPRNLKAEFEKIETQK